MSFGVYIHVPFCRRRCTYCDFYLTTNTKLLSGFVKSLKKEIALFAASAGDKNVDTVFFGGGTPSLLGERELSEIFGALNNEFTVADNAEVSLECNPEDISNDENKLRELASAGINRLSIGVQSFLDYELRFLTREHTSADSRESVIKAKKYFKNVSIDLIYSLPGQTKEKLTKNLDEVRTLEIPHVSAYTLIFEQGTVLFRDMSKNKVSRNPDSVESELYHTVNEYLRSLGYAHYEISNYAMNGYESRHNLKYWDFGEYAGFGPSAHSFFGGKRWNNVPSVSKYITSLKNDALPQENIEIQTPDKLETDYFICTLRSKGVKIDEFNGMFSKDFEKSYAAQIIENIRNRNALLENGYFRLTEKGFALADSITLEFLK